MAEYDYKEGKKRIEEILDNDVDVNEKDKLPDDNKFTFSNSYYSWVTAIFVDIRESSKLFAEGNKKEVSKIIRSFTSEIIEILRKDDNNDNNLREIGIRGDCVYAVYTTPCNKDIYESYQKTVYINTFIKMLNKLLSKYSLTKIKVGIGMSTAKELVVKAGRDGVGINSKVWIGKAVSRASNLSSLGNKDDNNPLVYSKMSYINFIEKAKKNNGEEFENNFNKLNDNENEEYYTANIVKINFNDWIESGMK